MRCRVAKLGTAFQHSFVLVRINGHDQHARAAIHEASCR